MQIEKYARHIATTPEIHERLSKAELDHAKRSAPYSNIAFPIGIYHSPQIRSNCGIPLQSSCSTKPPITTTILERRCGVHATDECVFSTSRTSPVLRVVACQYRHLTNYDQFSHTRSLTVPLCGYQSMYFETRRMMSCPDYDDVQWVLVRNAEGADIVDSIPRC